MSEKPITESKPEIRDAKDRRAKSGKQEAQDKQPHYFDAVPAVASDPREVSCRFSGIDFSFRTDAGVFSKNRPDFGSELMLNTFIEDRKAGTANGVRIMDLGCGYGLVGTVIKRVFPETWITMADINQRAIALASKNAERNHVKFADVRVSDVFSDIEGTFDIILTNPPVRAGKKTVFRFYEESFGRLTPDGILYVVIQRKQGAPSSSEKLENLFGNCIVAAKSAGYRVLKCTKV